MKITPQKVSEIASVIGAKFVGDPAHLVTGLNEVHRVEAGDLMFVDHPKYYDKALKSAATTILINKEVECPEGKALIFSDDPFRDYNKLVLHFQPVSHSLKPVSDSAVVGAGSVIHPGVYLGNNITVGTDCVLMPGVVVYDNCVIGNNVRIHANSVIGGDAFYYKKRPEKFDKMFSCGRVVIHDDVEIGACCTIDRGVSADTIIGRGTKMDNQVHIGHDTVIGEMCLFAAAVAIAGVVTVEDRVTLWGQVAVTSDVVLGAGAVVLGASGVSKSLEGGKTYFGSPAEEARGKWKELAVLRRLAEGK
ncbi:MAG TPA: UDP-3-O-(3-hydroxymyristoyl)glucosamine N-acyltransferase [Bacteroidia bacterium]|nr:UDP-3-O-(3-hydroxymyristoyl)glucosamine N-acyltransferase [Bacteroidia bacterium]